MIDVRDEPNPADGESSGRRKARPDFFKPPQWFGAKTVPPRMPHGVSECLTRPYSKAIGPDVMNHESSGQASIRPQV